MRIVSISFIAFILGFCTNTFAQNPYIRHYTAIDGLPTNTIYQICQDRNKFLWFTSDAGVTRFDGFNFTSYRKKDGLSSNDVVRIKEDRKGRIWLFGYNGSVNYIYNNIIYNGKNAPFLNSLMGKGFLLDFYTDSTNQTINFYNWQGDIFSLDTNNNVIKDVLLQNIEPTLSVIGRKVEKGNVSYLSKSPSDEWIIWCSIGVYSQLRFHTTSIKIVDTSLRCIAVFPARNNTYYVKTYTYQNHAFICELLKVTGDLQKVKIQLPFNALQIKTVLEDSEGYIWIAAYNEGVYCIKDNKIVKHFDIKNALGLLQDHEQNIWISSQSDGVYMISHDILDQNHYDPAYFNNHGIHLMCKSPEGIWCANSKAVYLLKNTVFYKLSVPIAVQPVDILYLFKDQTLMLGTISSRLHLFEDLTLNAALKKISYSKRMEYNVLVKKIINDNRGFVTTMFDQNNLFFVNSFKPSLNIGFQKISQRVNNAYYNTDNMLVINAKENYLYKNNKLEPYPELARFNGAIIHNHAIMNDSDELFNIDGDSLFILKNHKFYNLTEAFDIPITEQINKFIYDDSTLYLATLKDIFICHNPLNIISGIPVHIEPLNISFNNINDILIQKDTLYIANDDGLTLIAKTSIAKSISLPPIPYLQSIKVNDNIYSLPDHELKLTGKNKIELSFGCISYSSGSVIYSYLLEGSESKWTVGSGSNINLIYQNLPKGKYIFKLRVKKSNSSWSKPLELEITIKPTLFEHPAFWIFVVLIISALIFLIVFGIRSQKLKKVEVNHQLIVMEQKALQSMMNPHFIFNSLGSIQNFLLKNKGSEAVIYLSQFAQLIRQNLNAINMPMILLEEEVGRLKNYLDLERKRLDYKFDYSIEIDERFEKDSVYIPSMIIQPIAENSIWHGLATLEKDGFIKINIETYKPKSLKISIEDNGIGVKKSIEYTEKNSHHKHLGMQIIEKRLNLLSKKYSTETSINYSESNPSHNNPGTIVILILPFIDTISDI